MSGRHDPAMLRQAQQPGFVLTPPNPNPGWTISRLRSMHRIPEVTIFSMDFK